jgi:hypothetical protein
MLADFAYIALETGLVYAIIHLLWAYDADSVRRNWRPSELGWVCSASKGLSVQWNGGSLSWRKGEAKPIVTGEGCTIGKPHEALSSPARIQIKTKDSVVHRLVYHKGECRYEPV